MQRALLQTRTQLAAAEGRTAAARLMSSTAEPEAASAKSSSLRNFLLALIPIGVMGAVFEKNHLDSMAETEAREAADRASGHTPPPRVTASGGVTSHGVEIDADNPLNKLLPDTDCEYCLETRQKIYDMFKHMGHKEPRTAKSTAKPTAEPAPKPAAAGAARPADEGTAPHKPVAAAQAAEAAPAPAAAAAPVAAAAAEAAEASAAGPAGGGVPAAPSKPAAPLEPAPVAAESASSGQ